MRYVSRPCRSATPSTRGSWFEPATATDWSACAATRCALAQERLSRTSEGDIWLTLRHRWAEGTTHLRFDPLELVERLAVLTPRPRVNLILYYGVLAPRALWRAAIVPETSDGVDIREEADPEDGDATDVWDRRPGLSALRWAAGPRGTD